MHGSLKIEFSHLSFLRSHMADLSQSLSVTVSPEHEWECDSFTFTLILKIRALVQGHFHHAKVSSLGVLVHLIHQNKLVLLG